MSAEKHKIINNSNNSGERKISAFTLAELMIIMSVMTVILAAVAPIFTSRFTNASFDNVWSTVGASNMNDIYADAPIRSMMQQILIGITPIDMEDIRRTYRPYSKLVIRSSHQVGGNKKQKQIEFRVNGNTTGYMFAGNTNTLLGGEYNNINFDYNPTFALDPTTVNVNKDEEVSEDGLVNKSYGNTALGVKALNSITRGQNNSAFGYQALSSLTTGSENTAIGYTAGSSLTTGKGNTLIGYNSYNASTGNYNTIIGNNNSSESGDYITAVGNNVSVGGEYNTAIGDGSNAKGFYNTAIGAGALAFANSNNSSDNFSYNTAVGYNSCSGISNDAQNTTCIGGNGLSSEMNKTAKELINDDHYRVFIGKSSSKYGSAATLEVHSLSSANSQYPYPGDGAPSSSYLGDSSVIVNGNLIVRGQTYMNGRSPFPIEPKEEEAGYSANTISLMGYRLYKESKLNHKPLIGMDGSEHLRKMVGENGSKHEKITGREHCICTYSCKPADNKGLTDNTGLTSYDWFKRESSNNKISITNSQGNQEDYYYNSHICGTTYNSNSHSDDHYEFNKAHITTNAGFNNITQLESLNDRSCCPMLNPSGNQFNNSNITSDIRLKNLNSPFNDGVLMLSKLNIYNYTFKSDKSNTQNVGVIAQDLKRVFPNAVTKDDRGYYKIRTDEMFYSAINSVKELYQNITELFAKVNNYIARITKLKKENNELKNQLLILSKQLDELEK